VKKVRKPKKSWLYATAVSGGVPGPLKRLVINHRAGMVKTYSVTVDVPQIDYQALVSLADRLHSTPAEVITKFGIGAVVHAYRTINSAALKKGDKKQT
jgi:hypothetical protein